MSIKNPKFKAGDVVRANSKINKDNLCGLSGIVKGSFVVKFEGAEGSENGYVVRFDNGVESPCFDEQLDRL